MASDGFMDKYEGKRKTSYLATIELSEPQVIMDLSYYCGTNISYRNRIIANKTRHFWRAKIPNLVFQGNEPMFLRGRPMIYDLYINSFDKDSFIRGLFDGDGCVSEVPSNHSHLRIGFSINYLCNDIKLILQHYCMINDISISVYLDKRGNKSWYMSINKMEDVEKFFRNIYKNNPELFLERKYNIFVNHGFPDLVTNHKKIW